MKHTSQHKLLGVFITDLINRYIEASSPSTIKYILKANLKAKYQPRCEHSRWCNFRFQISHIRDSPEMFYVNDKFTN